MKNFTYSVISLILFSAVLSGCSEKQPGTHQQRLSLLNVKISDVNSALEQAEGFQKKSGNIDLQVATFFSEYIEWELDNPEITKDAEWSQMKFENGYFRINDRPVFSGGFNVIDHSLVDAAKYPEWRRQ